MDETPIYAAFHGNELLFRGALSQLIPHLLKESQGSPVQALILDERSGKELDIDWRGEDSEVLARAQEQLERRSAGRPKLGVRSKEVTLLPRQWAWLEQQRGSISANLRKIVDLHIKSQQSEALQVDPLYRAMSAMAGDRVGFEEASRALYAQNWDSFRSALQAWPPSIAQYLGTRLDELLGVESSAQSPAHEG